MASGGGSQKNEDSNDSISKPGPSAEPAADKKDISWLINSCPPIMVHTKCKHRRPEGNEKPENQPESSSSKQPSTREITKNSNGESNRHEGEPIGNDGSNRHEGEPNGDRSQRHEGEANRSHRSNRHRGERNRNDRSNRHRGERNRNERANRHRGERNRNDGSNSPEVEEPLIWGFLRNVASQTDAIGSHFNNRTFYENFRDCYNENVREMRHSWIIFVFQFLVGLLAASAIIMGIIFFRSCVGAYPATVPAFTILMGITGAVLLYKWLDKVCRERRGDRYWNSEKNKLALCFIALLFFMVLELIFFCNVSPSNLQLGHEIKCNKIYFTYMYCLHIVNAVFLVLAALLYLPDCVIYISKFKFLQTSNTNGDYQPL